MKNCDRCKKSKSELEFHRHRSKKDGLCPTCKLCRKNIRKNIRALPCRVCGGVKPSGGGRRYCDNCQEKAINNSRYRNRRIGRRLWAYNMDNETFMFMILFQGGRCANTLCSNIIDETNAQIDHDHKCCPTAKTCGKCVRGLLCTNCNLGIGNLQDNPNLLLSAVNYLRSFEQGVSLQESVL